VRFSKQLKTGLSESRREGFGPASTSVGRSSDVLTGRVSASTVETCQEYSCLTDSLTPLCSSMSPLPSKLTSGPEMSHTCRFEKNIFTSIRLTEITSDQLMKTENRDDKMIPSDSVENEISAPSSKCLVSSSFSAGEQISESPPVTRGSGSMPVSVMSDVVEADNSEQKQSTSCSEIQSSNGAKLCTSGPESTLSGPETEPETSLHDDCNKSGIKPDGSVRIWGLNPDVVGSSMQQNGQPTPSDADCVATVDCDADQSQDEAAEEITLDKKAEVKDNETADGNSGVRIDPTRGGNCVDSIAEDSSIKISTSDTSLSELSVVSGSVSALHLGMSSISNNILVNSTASSPIMPVDVAKNDTEVRTRLQGSDSPGGGPDNLPNVSSDCATHGSVGTSESSVNEESTGISETPCCCSFLTEHEFASQHNMSEERCHHLQPFPSEDCHTSQTVSMSCADTLRPQITVSNSCPVPVSLFCAQSNTASTLVPVALFCAHSCSSAVPENSRVLSQDVPLASSDMVFSGLSEVSVSVSDSQSEISHMTVQHNPPQLPMTVQEETEKAGNDGNVSKCPASDVVSSCQTIWNTEILSSSDTRVSDMPQCLSNSTSRLTMPATNPEVLQQCSVTIQVSSDSVSSLQQCPSTKGPKTDISIEERKYVVSSDAPVSNYNSSDLEWLPDVYTVEGDRVVEEQKDIAVTSDEPDKCVSGESVISFTNVPESDSSVEERKDFDETSNAIQVSSYAVSDLQQLSNTSAVEEDCQIGEQKDFAVTNSGKQSECILDESIIPITNISATDCEMEQRNDSSKTSSVMELSGCTVSHLQQLSDTNPVDGNHQEEEQKTIAVINSDEPDECISDESIVSQILAADCSQSDSLDYELMSQSLVSNCSGQQQWREMVSPVVSSKQCSQAPEDNSDRLSSVTAEDVNSNSFVDDDSVKDLIQSADLNMSYQSRDVSEAVCEEQQHGELALLPVLVPGNDGWMYDAKELQDVLCSLLNSCHMNSTDPDNSLPLDNDVDDDARSCSSSATEVYVDLPEDLKLDDVSDQCGSPQDKDSDGTVSPLSVVLDGDGLDLMDSASDGFQNIYSSLVGAAAMDTVLSSDANDLNSSVCCGNATTANLSAFAVEHSLASLLDKEGSSAVMALDAGLVKNLPCPTASVASLCDRLEESSQQPKNDNEDGLQTDVAGKPVSCHCSKPHTSKKSCRSSLRMPEKLADVDPASPLLACRPPPLSVHGGKCGTDTHYTSDVAEGGENAVASSVNATSAGLGDETVNQVRSRKRKCSVVSDTMNESDIKHSSSVAEMKSGAKRPVEILLAAKKTRRKQKKDSLKSIRDADKIQVTPRNLSKNSAVETERYTFRISASQVKKPVGYTSSVIKGQVLSEERPTTRSLRSTEQIQQTMFTLEHTRTGSTRTVILRKPTCPPMLSTGKTSSPKWKVDHISSRQRLNCSNQSDIQHKEKEKKPSSCLEKPRRQTAADETGAEEIPTKVGSEVENETDEEFSLKKMVLRSDRSSSTKRDRAQSNNSSRVSQGNRNRAGRRKSRNRTQRTVSDQGSRDGSSESRGKQRKCLLLAQLENSAGYVAERSVSQQHNNSLLWSDSSTLSREERALQVSHAELGLELSS